MLGISAGNARRSRGYRNRQADTPFSEPLLRLSLEQIWHLGSCSKLDPLVRVGYPTVAFPFSGFSLVFEPNHVIFEQLHAVSMRRAEVER